MTSSGESSASIWMPFWFSGFYAAICSRVQTPTQSGQCVIMSPVFLFSSPCLSATNQSSTLRPRTGSNTSKPPYRCSPLAVSQSQVLNAPLVCTEIDTQTLAGSRSSAHCQRARAPGGLRSRCKALGRVLSQRHSFVNLVPRGMLCRGTSL